MRIVVGDDFSKYRRPAHDALSDRDAMYPMFDITRSFIDSSNGFWVCGFSPNDELIHTQAVHLLDLSSVSLAEHSIRIATSTSRPTRRPTRTSRITPVRGAGRDHGTSLLPRRLLAPGQRPRRHPRTGRDRRRCRGYLFEIIQSAGSPITSSLSSRHPRQKRAPTFVPAIAIASQAGGLAPTTGHGRRLHGVDERGRSGESLFPESPRSPQKPGSRFVAAS